MTTSAFKQIIHNPLLWVALLLLFPLLNEVVFSDFVREGEYNSRIGWSLIIAFLITYADRRWVTALLLLPFAIGGSADIGYAYSFGGVFTTATMEAVAYTDQYEIIEYLKAYSSWQLILLLLAQWSIYAAAVYFCRRTDSRKYRKFITVAGMLLLTVVVYRTSVMGKYHDTIPGILGTLPSYYRGSISLQQEVDLRREMVSKTDVQATLRHPEQKQLHILIIGESATRNHMGIYGYHRKTTPHLSAIKDQLIVLDNVISSHVQTQASLRVALTAADADSGDQYRQALSIIDISNLAGYKTFWISNQQPQRATIASISTQADVTHYISNDFHGVEVRRFDEYMLDSVKQAIADPAPQKVILIHMMGSHAQYRNRFPESLAHFAGDDVNAYRQDPSADEISAINDYDNSILYSDYVVSEIIKLTSAADHEVRSTVTYFSDHGEEVYQQANVKGHTPDNLTSNMMEIPFIVWFSDKNDPEAAVLKEHSNKPFMLDSLFHYALDTLDINSSALIEDNSPASATFAPDSYRVVYGKRYEEDFQLQHNDAVKLSDRK